MFHNFEASDVFNHSVDIASFLISVVLITVSVVFVGCHSGNTESAAKRSVQQTPVQAEEPLGLPPMPTPPDNPLTQEKIALGKKLFFDPLLSADRTVSCSTCHDPDQGWSNGEPFGTGIAGQKGKRNSVSIVNSGYHKKLFWDGRATSLEQQALVPLFNESEMGMESEAELLERLQSSQEYVRLFDEAFESGLTVANVAKAIASFERTIVLGDTAFDRYEAGDKSAMSDSAIRGMRLFFNDRRGGANCGGCHAKPLFTDQEFYNTGIGMDQPNPDLGYHNTLGWGFKGAFRSPSLRGIASTAPYMHNGSLETLEEVVDYYARGGNRNPSIDPGVKRLRLNKQDKQDLVTFLREGLSPAKATE